MSRSIRRACLLAVFALAALPLTASVAGSQELPASSTTITVKKVVTGAGSPSSVSVDCQGNDTVDALDAIVLNFDASGHPTTQSAGNEFAIVDGAFVATGPTFGGGTCTFTETSTGGARTTAFTCDYTFTPVDVPESQQIQQAGCLQASGSGVGPVQVNYPGESDVSEQASTVVFTSTFDPAAPLQPIQPAASVVVQPLFTG